MKKLLSIILTLLMVVNLGVFATVSAEETNPALEFKGNAKALLEIAVKHAQTTGTFANSTIALTQGQSITYTINSDEATPVKFWWNNHATFNGTQTYDLTINGEKVVEGGTLTHNGTSNSVAFTNSATANTFNFVEGENTFVFTLTSGSVEKINALYIADAEYNVGEDAVAIHALANVSNFIPSEFTLGDGNNYYRVWRSSSYLGKDRSPKFNLNVAEAGLYEIVVPIQDNEYKWTVTVDPAGTPVSYTTSSAALNDDDTYKVAVVPLKQGANTIRLEWDGTSEFALFKTFTIKKAPDAEVKCNSSEITELGAEYATTTGTKASNVISVSNGQSITYTFKSEEETDVRLWWNNDASFSSDLKFDLSVNGAAQMTDAALSGTSGRSISIGKVSLAQGENTVVFTLKAGTLSNIKKLYITDAEIKLSTKERTNIHALSTTDGLPSEMRINSASDAYMELRWKNNLNGANRTPKFYLNVEEEGDYDIYLPSEGTTFVWEIWVNEEPASWGADSATYVDTTVEEEGLYKAFTVRLNEGENYIVIAWNRGNKYNNGSFNNFTGLAIEKTKAPSVDFVGNSATLAEFNISNAITTGLKTSTIIKLEAGQSLTYNINSNEATPVMLWWNQDATLTGDVTYDLVINDEKAIDGATLVKNATSDVINIGASSVNFAEGENTVVFKVLTGTLSNINTLFVVDAEYTVGGEESTEINILSATNRLAYYERMGLAGSNNYWRILDKGTAYNPGARQPVFNINVTEAGDYDLYIPSYPVFNGNDITGHEHKWKVTVDPNGAATEYTVDATVEAPGTYKLATIALAEGLNTIKLEWKGTSEIQKANYAIKTFTLTKAPVVELKTVATVTGTANEGLSVSIDAANLVDTEVLASVAVYKVKDGNKQLVTSDLDVVTVTEEAISLSTAAVAAEEGYTYEYKVFVWNSTSLAPYAFEIN